MSLCKRAAGISTFSGFIRDIDKFEPLHSTRRTVAMASLKVGSSLAYQAADLGWRARATLASAAHRVMRENRPSRAGVVRAMARSDHWRWVSTPRCSRVSWNVVSMDQRWTYHPRMVAGAASRSVHRKAWGLRISAGVRTTNNRVGRGGSPPWYQIAGSLADSRRPPVSP